MLLPVQDMSILAILLPAVLRCVKCRPPRVLNVLTGGVLADSEDVLETAEVAWFTYGPRPMMAVSLDQIDVSLSFLMSESLRNCGCGLRR